MTKFIYYRVAMPGDKHEKFVRLERENANEQWRALCANQDLKLPFIVFDNFTGSEVKSFQHVALGGLRKCAGRVAREIDAAWSRYLENQREKINRVGVPG